MDVILLIEKGSNETRSIRLKRAPATIGRRHGCDVRIPSERVSRRHCILTCQDNTLTVEDLNSANGTFLNDARVLGRQPVQPGDRLTVGPVTFLVQYEPATPASADAATIDEVVPVGELVVLAEGEDWGEDLVSLEEEEPTRASPRKKNKSATRAKSEDDA